MTAEVVLKLGIHDDDKTKRKAMNAVSSISGIDSLAIDIKEKKLTVVGAVDPVEVVRKLRKSWHTELLTVGPTKEQEKNKEDESKKDDAKKEDDKQKGIEQIEELWKQSYKNHYSYCTPYYYGYSAEENPNACVFL